MAHGDTAVCTSADEWESFLLQLPPNGPVRAVILESWARSRTAGVAHANGRLPRRIGETELSSRLERSNALVELARPHLEWLSTALRLIPHVAYLTDRDGIVLCSSGDPELQRRFGLTPGYDWSEQSMGTNGAGTALATGQPVAVVGAEHYCCAFHDCTCTAAPVRAEGELVGAIDVSTSVADASPERLVLVSYSAFGIERELAHRTQTLQHRANLALTETLRRQEDALRIAHERLQEEDRRKDEFLAVLAHELRNPLAPIRNAAQILRVADSDPAAVASVRDVIDRQLGHLVRLIDDLLDISRITQGRLELLKERVDLAHILRTAVEASSPYIEARQHRLETSWSENALFIDADPTRIAQVISNLLNNSARYSDAGSRIRLTAEECRGNAIVTVTDTGIGIPPHMLTRVFQMFRQVEHPERRREGLGIGLTLVKRLVEMHGGTVEARSEGLGMGSQFVVTLPLAPLARGAGESAARHPSPECSAAGAITGQRILIADDNEDSAASLAMVLQFDGHEVRVAHDGMQALEVAEQFRPQVVLLDIGMPRLDGCDVARRLRSSPWSQSVRLIALTGWAQDNDRRRAQEAGFDEYLVKPIDPETLRALIATVTVRSVPPAPPTAAA